MPQDDTPDDGNTGDDGELGDRTDTGEVATAAAEAEAGFLDDRDPADYPDVLRFTANPEATHRREALDRMDRWEDGEAVPHVVNFERPSDLRSLLTDRRIELLRSVMTEQPGSIRQLAERIGRDVKSVHSDLRVLAEYDVVHFERDGRAKRPFVPYETIEVSLEISSADGANDVASA